MPSTPSRRLARTLAVLVLLPAGAAPAVALSGCHAGDDVHVSSDPSNTDRSPVTGDDTH